MARQFNLIPPVCEQAEYHFFQREKVETQLPELYHKIGRCVVNFRCPKAFLKRAAADSLFSLLSGHCVITGVGVVSWSPLACGIITGKYENGIPESSRAAIKVEVEFHLAISSELYIPPGKIC